MITTAFQEKEEEKEIDLSSSEPEAPLPLTVTSRVLNMLGDITAGPAFRFAQWLELVRKRNDKHRLLGFSNRHSTQLLGDAIHLSGTELTIDSENSLQSVQATEVSLWERFGKAAKLDIDSDDFSWDYLSSLHHTGHSSSTEHSEDEMNKALEVTVNSGGVVFFALFNHSLAGDSSRNEAAAVIKVSSSRIATQSERLGYEFAKWLGVRAPQARVIHNNSPEWLQIKKAAERARDAAIGEGDEVGELTCSELLEALELSRCLLLMSYVHGSPLLESSNAFDTQKAAKKTAAALGRVLMLDLVIRNEDRLPCHQLRWRGNSANLLLANKMVSADVDMLEEAFDSAMQRYRPRVIRALQKERRSTSVDSRLSASHSGLESDMPEMARSPHLVDMGKKHQALSADFHIVVIDSGVPRRPPAGKRAGDQANYPRMVELLLNSFEYSSNLLHEISAGKLGFPADIGADVTDVCLIDMNSVVHEFRNGFRAALRDLQGFHIFLLTLHQKLDSQLRSFLTIISRTMSGDYDKDDMGTPETVSISGGSAHWPSPSNKERATSDSHPDSNSGSKDGPSSISPMSREGWHGKLSRGNSEPFRCMRLTTKLRDFHKFAKMDADSSKELEQWNEMVTNEAVKLCQENNFTTGFFECNDNTGVVDAYELKVRLEHILERISLISDAANTERPSSISSNLFIGGALAARSIYVLQHLGITHILCLCSNEIGQSDSQYPDLFEYKNFSIPDSEDTNIGSIFEEASDFIDHVEDIGGKVLVHCFEGRSRSATLVIAYLMLRKNQTLTGAWNTLKRVHCRAQPNDGFARMLQDLDRRLHGKVSMEWQQRKPAMKICPICGKDAGLSSSSLKLHLQKSHKKLSSGSVDSAMDMEIQRALSALNLTQGDTVSPKRKQSHASDRQRP